MRTATRPPLKNKIYHQTFITDLLVSDKSSEINGSVKIRPPARFSFRFNILQYPQHQLIKHNPSMEAL